MTHPLDDELEALEWGVERSIRYHERRQAYYERADSLVNVINLITGSGAIVALTKGAPAALIGTLSAIVAVLSFINLTMRSSQMSAVHSQLKQRYVGLLKRVRRIEPTSADAGRKIRIAKLERLNIEGEEPTIYRTVDVLAHNELALSRGMGKDVLRYVPWFKRISAHFIRWEATGLCTMEEQEQRSSTEKKIHWSSVALTALVVVALVLCAALWKCLAA